MIGEHKKGALAEHGTKKIGPGKVFERLWKQTGIGDCLKTQLSGRRYQFDVESAIFMTVVHRLMEPGSDRAAEKWRWKQSLPQKVYDLDLHQLYRAMAWLGERLPDDQQEGRTPFAPRCVKDLIEEELFSMRRDLFTEVAVIFFDTTTLYFEGKGGQELGRRGKNKDHRPDAPQIVVGLVIDGEGRPLCCEMWPGNTTDVTTMLPIVDRLRKKFRVMETCVVADRGMISKKTISELEKRGINYILGARMRKQKDVAKTYKMLWMVEHLFRTVKSILDTRPIYHKWDETIRGHVFCSFLALILMRELQDRMAAKGHPDAEWADVLRDLDSVSETLVQSSDGKHFMIRSEARGWCGKTFQAAGVALPPTIRQVESPADDETPQPRSRA
ncbi:MAG: IS1634 family transposase [Polyangia bacterium]